MKDTKIENYEPTVEQQHEYIVTALLNSGFVRMDLPGEMYSCDNWQGHQAVVQFRDGNHTETFFLKAGKRYVPDKPDEAYDALLLMLHEAKDGIVPVNTHTQTPSEATDEAISSIPEMMTPAQALEMRTVPPVPARQHQPPAAYTAPDLNIEIIKKYINDKATDEEAFWFLQLCKARGLNPFIKEAYLIKYSHTAPASMVVGKDAFTRKAEQNTQFDGLRAGIIVLTTNGNQDERVGSFMKKDEELVGGWAEVHRKDHKHPSVCKVSFAEYNKPGQGGKQNNWDKIPATMIRKVALVQALREAFPSELGGMYDSSEMGVDV